MNLYIYSFLFMAARPALTNPDIPCSVSENHYLSWFLLMDAHQQGPHIEGLLERIGCSWNL